MSVMALGVYPFLGAAAMALFFLGADHTRLLDGRRPRTAVDRDDDFLKSATLFGAALLLVAPTGTAGPYALNLGP